MNNNGKDSKNKMIKVELIIDNKTDSSKNGEPQTITFIIVVINKKHDEEKKNDIQKNVRDRKIVTFQERKHTVE